MASRDDGIGGPQVRIRSMTDLLAARSQMALSLAFHIVFSVVGIAMPVLMAVAEALWLRTGERTFLELAQRWAKGTAILFAVGAVSGTVLSFELGLLWPTFMAYAGPIFGMPFSLEGFAFFLEAIFLGIYLYGWTRVPPLAHWLAGVAVAVSGTLSGIFVVIANGWMNTPAGFVNAQGRPTQIDPIAAMKNAAAFPEAVHMTLAAFAAVGFVVAGIHAALLRSDRGNVFHRRALAIALAMGGAAALVQPLSGDWSARHVAEHQPVKLAAMEAQFETEPGAALRVGGWPDPASETTRYAIEIPYGLSLLAFHDPHAEVVGLKAVPRDERPPVAIVHLAFDVMVGCGSAMALVGLIGGALAWRPRGLPDERWYLNLLALVAPLGFIAVEAGWTVTEVGRQPWIIHGVMRTADAVTPMPHLVIPFTTFTALYLLLAAVVVVLLRRQVFASPRLAAPEA
jgi:cytochrome d ubiquinol oxidase subunit I